MVRAFATIVLGLALVPCAWAGKYNSKLNIGDPAPVFKDLEGADGKRHSLADYKNKDVVVLCVMCNHCPIVHDYEDRIKAFAKKYAAPDSKLAFIAISVSKEEEDSLPKMKVRAKEQGFGFAYLCDPTQKIGRALGASATPEFFVLNKERKLVYMGAMDDDIDEPKVKYLESAVEAVLKGQTPRTQETRVKGCGIEYAKQPKLEPASFHQLQKAIQERRGEVVVVDVWATWCSNCKKDFPRVVELYRRLGKDGVCCMSVSVDKPKKSEEALAFLSSHEPLAANFIMDDGDSIRDQWDFNGVPAVFVFDRDGKLARKFTGDDPDKQFTYDEVTRLVEELQKQSSRSGK